MTRCLECGEELKIMENERGKDICMGCGYEVDT